MKVRRDFQSSFHHDLVLLTHISIYFIDQSSRRNIVLKLQACCVAKYFGDNCWYRGRVLQILGTEVDILFVDHGFRQMTPIDLVKDIDKEFLSLPPQAYKCGLMNVLSTSLSSEDKLRFKRTTVGKRFKAVFETKLFGCKKYHVQLRGKLADGSTVSVNQLFASPSQRPFTSPTLLHSSGVQTTEGNLPGSSRQVQIVCNHFHLFSYLI